MTERIRTEEDTRARAKVHSEFNRAWGRFGVRRKEAGRHCERYEARLGHVKAAQDKLIARALDDRISANFGKALDG